MYLGLVATHDAAGPQLLGLAAAAVARGWPVRCFLTHAGVRLDMHVGHRIDDVDVVLDFLLEHRFGVDLEDGFGRCDAHRFSFR